MALVSNKDLQEAWYRWSQVWGQGAPCDWYDFFEGPIEMKPPSSGMWEVSDTVAERIRLITSSPHYHALLKAWAVQRASMEVAG